MANRKSNSEKVAFDALQDRRRADYENRMITVAVASEALKKLTDEMRDDPENVNSRWTAIGVTDLQKGLMALRKALYNNSTF